MRAILNGAAKGIAVVLEAIKALLSTSDGVAATKDKRGLFNAGSDPPKISRINSPLSHGIFSVVADGMVRLAPFKASS